MNVVPLFIAYPKTAELVQPGQTSSTTQRVFTQPTSVLPLPCRCQANGRLHPPQTQLQSMRLGVISGISFHHLEPLAGPSPFATNRANRIHQRKKLGCIVPSELP